MALVAVEQVEAEAAAACKAAALDKCVVAIAAGGTEVAQELVNRIEGEAGTSHSGGESATAAASASASADDRCGTLAVVAIGDVEAS
jgi:hypothetical protein